MTCKGRISILPFYMELPPILFNAARLKIYDRKLKKSGKDAQKNKVGGCSEKPSALLNTVRLLGVFVSGFSLEGG